MTGIMRITPELLADLLCLPPGTVLSGAALTDTQGFGLVIDLTVTHPDIIAAASGAEPPIVVPRYNRTPDSVVHFVDWGQ